MPLYESQQVDVIFVDPPMTAPPAIASRLLNDSPAKRINESTSYKLRDQPLSQVAPNMYNPSNVSDDVSHDEDRNPQDQL